MYILGSNFPSGEKVTINITTTGDDRLWTTATVNDFGAFRVSKEIPTWVSTSGPISVKAWIDLNGNGDFEEDEGELQACWPLYVH